LSRQVIGRVASIVAVAACVAVCIAAGAGAATSATASTRYSLKARLNTQQEVPKAKDAVHARGVLTAEVKLAGKKSSFLWHLTLSGLSGRARTAVIRIGRPGRTGPIAITLCRPCNKASDGGSSGAYFASRSFLKPLLHGRMYVNVTTKLNSKGEIRGEIKATAA
jgi:hypothetical protein